MNETMKDGGPAFPMLDQSAVHRRGADAIEGVTDTAEIDRLYIEAIARAGAGMSLRDYFAAKAMAGMLAKDGWPVGTETAQSAYVMADCMLHARGTA